MPIIRRTIYMPAASGTDVKHMVVLSGQDRRNDNTLAKHVALPPFLVDTLLRICCVGIIRTPSNLLDARLVVLPSL
jgi:hypothetical protein